VRLRLADAALALAGGLGALAIAAVGLCAVLLLHLPVPVRDLVDLQLPYLLGADLLSVLLRVHVDHVLMFQRLLAWVDLFWLRGELWASLGATVLACAAVGLLVAQAAWRDAREAPGALPRALPPLAGLVASAGLLWLGNGYNLAWALQACFFMVPAFALAALARLMRRPSPGTADLAVALLLAACATVTVGTGLVAVLALALVVLSLRLPRRVTVPWLPLLALLPAAAWWLGGLGAKVDAAETSPWQRLGEPLLLLDYLRRYLAEPARLALDAVLAGYQARVAAQVLLAAGLLALLADGWRLVHRRRRPARLAAQGHLLCLLAIGSGLATGLARLDGNPAQAASLRYLTTGLLFWIGLLLLALSALRTAPPAWRKGGLAGLLVVQLVLLAGLPRFWSDMRVRQAEVAQAAAHLLGGEWDDEALRRITRDPERARLYFSLLRALPGGLYRREEAAWIGQPAEALATKDPRCLDDLAWLSPRTTAAGTLALAGWSTQGGTTPDAILLLDAAGRVEAIAWPTPGVLPAARPPDAADLGWELWVTPAQRAKGSLARLQSDRLCPLPWP
jgi:hypothetical protein